MNLQGLAEFIYEDLEARVNSVLWDQSILKLSISCDDPREDRRRKFQITCHDAVEARVSPTAFGNIQLPNVHPLLLDHTDAFGYLAFSSIPNAPEQVLAKLYETHYSTCGEWRALSSYLNHHTREGVIALLKGGKGMIAEGPYELMQAYQSSISNLLQTSLIKKERPQKPAGLLLLDSEYVIARTFESHEEL